MSLQGRGHLSVMVKSWLHCLSCCGTLDPLCLGFLTCNVGQQRYLFLRVPVRIQVVCIKHLVPGMWQVLFCCELLLFYAEDSLCDFRDKLGLNYQRRETQLI